MTARERPIGHADRATDHALATIGREIRAARVAAGLSQDDVAKASGTSGSRMSRVEAAQVGSVSVRVLARLCATVGLDLVIRAYPGGDPLRDAAQVRLLERFRRRLGPGLGWRTEVPLPIPGDRRAWDGMIGGPGWHVAVEAETRVTDVQALGRRLALKQRDGGVDCVILLLADTRTNRAVLLAVRAAFEGTFPANQGAILSALDQGERPPASGIVIL